MTEALPKSPEFKELEFDEATHTYRLNGEVIPSVTTVMEPLKRAQYEGIDGASYDRNSEGQIKGC